MRHFTDPNGPKEDHMKMNFESFQIQKWMLQTINSEKVGGKNGAICLVSMFQSLSYGPLSVEKSAFFAILCWPQ